VPFEIIFDAFYSGGVGPYTLSWTICHPGLSHIGAPDCTDETGNQIAYLFKLAVPYTITATVADAEGQTEGTSATIDAVGGTYEAGFGYVQGDTTTPFLSSQAEPTIQVGGFQAEGTSGVQGNGLVTSSAGGDTLSVSISLNWGGFILPSAAATFLGFDYPWYAISAEDQYGTASGGPLVQIGQDGTATVLFNLAGLEAPGGGIQTLLYQDFAFTASPTTPLAVTMDLVSAVFAASGLLPGSVPPSVLTIIAKTVAHTFAKDIVGVIDAIGTSTFFQQLSNLLSNMLTAIVQEAESLAISFSGSVALDLTKFSNTAASKAAALGDFLLDMETLLDSAIKGNFVDTYSVGPIVPAFSVVSDPTQPLNTLLETSAGTVGYSNGTWENTQNLTGFIHTAIMNGSYGFWLPVSSNSLNATVAVSSANATGITYTAYVYFGNGSRALTGTLLPGQKYAAPVLASGQLIVLAKSGPDYALYASGVVIVGLLMVVAFLAVRVRRKTVPTSPKPPKPDS
jgi:hypothetical protein